MLMNKTHMHPSIIVESVFTWFWASIVLVFATIIKEIDEANNLMALAKDFLSFKIVLLIIIGVLLFLLIIAFISYLIWRRTYIYIDDNFNYVSGRLFKKHIKINLNDIATIIVRKNLIERLFHTSRIKLELNAGGDDTIARKMVFKDEVVDQIKSLVFKKEEIKPEEIESLVHYNSADITKHLLLSTNILSMIIIILFLGFTFYFATYDFNFKSLIVIVVFFFAAIVPIVWSIIKRYFDYHNFKLWFEDNKIKVSYGLFVNYKYEIPKNKINAVVISQTLQARLCNKYVISLINAGVGNEEGEQAIICLYSDKKQIDFLMKELLPDFINDNKVTLQANKSLGTYLINKVPLMFVMAIICMWFSKWLLLVNLLFIIWAFIQYKTKNIKIGDELITVTNGFFVRNSSTIKYKKVTKIDFVDTIIGKLYNIKYLRINTVGAMQTATFNAGYYSVKNENKIVKLYK